MGERTTGPQLDDNVLLAELARLLPIRGALGEVAVSDIAVPVIPVPGPRALSTRRFRASVADVFTGSAVAPATGTTIADTGPLPAGDYSVIAVMSSDEVILPNELLLRHFDDAPAPFFIIFRGLALNAGFFAFPEMTYFLPEGHSLRITTLGASTVGSLYSATIIARRSA